MEKKAEGGKKEVRFYLSAVRRRLRCRRRLESLGRTEGMSLEPVGRNVGIGKKRRGRKKGEALPTSSAHT